MAAGAENVKAETETPENLSAPPHQLFQAKAVEKSLTDRADSINC